jgi:hypothetical protein
MSHGPHACIFMCIYVHIYLALTSSVCFVAVMYVASRSLNIPDEVHARIELTATLGEHAHEFVCTHMYT